MRVEFEANLDDIVDIQIRQLQSSKVAQGWKFQSCFYFGGAFVFIAYFLVDVIDTIFDAYLGEVVFGFLGKLLFGIACGGLTSIFYYFVYHWNMEQRLHSYYAEQVGAESFISWVEISPQGIRSGYKKLEVFYNWGHVHNIRVRSEGIDFLAKGGGILIVVLKRAFHSSREMDGFHNLALRYCDDWNKSTAIEEVQRP